MVKPKPVANPPNPWSSTVVEWLEEPPQARLEVFEEEAKSIVSENDSPDVFMRYSVNPYRGCMHACAYCYARPSHQYLGYGAGTDFDRKIVVKTNAPDLLRAHFDRRSWSGGTIVFSGNTDCYQPLEGSYALTRKCLEVCHDYRNPAYVITKSALVRRDVDVFTRLARDARFGITISIPFAEPEMARAIEPYASAPAARFETVRRLAEAGLEVGVNIAPLIPGLNDSQVGEILERAAEAGASRAALMPVRLAAEVLPVFFERLREAYPARVGKVHSALVQIRGGKLNESAFGKRMTGEGARWDAVEALFVTKCRKLGLLPREGEAAESPRAEQDEPSTFRRPSAQGVLFS